MVSPVAYRPTNKSVHAGYDPLHDPMPLVVANKNAIYDAYDPLEDARYKEGLSKATSTLDAIMTLGVGTIDTALNPSLREMLKAQRTSRQHNIAQDIAQQIAEKGNLHSLVGFLRIGQLFLLGAFNVVAAAWDMYDVTLSPRVRRTPWRQRLSDLLRPLLQFSFYTTGTILLLIGTVAAMFIAAPVLLATASWLNFGNKFSDYLDARALQKAGRITQLELVKQRNAVLVSLFSAVITTIVVISLFTPVAPITLAAMAGVGAVAYFGTIVYEWRLRKKYNRSIVAQIDTDCANLIDKIFDLQKGIVPSRAKAVEIKQAIAEQNPDTLLANLVDRDAIFTSLKQHERQLQLHGLSPRETREKINKILIAKLRDLKIQLSDELLGQVSLAILQRYDTQVQTVVFNESLEKLKNEFDPVLGSYNRMPAADKVIFLEKYNALCGMVDLQHHADKNYFDKQQDQFLKAYFSPDGAVEFKWTWALARMIWLEIELARPHTRLPDAPENQQLYERLFTIDILSRDADVISLVLKKELGNCNAAYRNYFKHRSVFYPPIIANTDPALANALTVFLGEHDKELQGDKWEALYTVIFQSAPNRDMAIDAKILQHWGDDTNDLSAAKTRMFAELKAEISKANLWPAVVNKQQGLDYKKATLLHMPHINKDSIRAILHLGTSVDRGSENKTVDSPKSNKNSRNKRK